MSRTIQSSHLSSANKKLVVTAHDERGHGGANHCYFIEGFDSRSNLSDPGAGVGISQKVQQILFQNGPLRTVEANGITEESLIAVLIDRLQGFQAGPFSCRENAIALTKLEEALLWLERRTQLRIDRGVEGTTIP